MTWLTGWKKRIKLDIDYTNKIGASVTHFPVAIFLKSDNGNSTKVFDEVGANSRKIAITKADGETELKGEIEQWDSVNEKGVIHTSITGWTINANTSIYLYYDNDHANNGNIGLSADGSVATHAVWDSNFKMVQHMVDDTTSAIKDSTSNNNDGAKLGAGEPAEADGKIGKGQDFDGSDDYVDCGSVGISGNAARTVSFWLKPNTLSDLQTPFNSGAQQVSQSFTLEINRPASGQIYFEGWGLDLHTAAILTQDVWHYIVITYDGTTTGLIGDAGKDSGLDIWVNGIQYPWLAYNYGDDSPLDTLDANYIIGARVTNLFFNGFIDEVRIYNRALSAEEILNLYNLFK